MGFVQDKTKKIVLQTKNSQPKAKQFYHKDKRVCFECGAPEHVVRFCPHLIRPKVAPPRKLNQNFNKTVKTDSKSTQAKPKQPNMVKPLDKVKGKLVNLDVPKVANVNQSKQSSI